MFRPASRVIARSSALRSLSRPAPTRRFLSTAPPSQKSRTWKSSAARWGIAGAVIYYYNTIDLFAEEPQPLLHALPQTEQETESLPTIDAVTKERQERKAALAAATEAAASAPRQETVEGAAPADGVEELEEEAGQQGAFNPETGEINWDCPCLGGMAHGPCGEEFKAAFSCFVYSTEEPKGVDCIEKFKGMQNCFREYPEIYGAELESDEDDNVTADDARTAVTAETATDSVADTASAAASSATGEKVGEQKTSPSKEDVAQRAQSATEQGKQDHEPLSESEEVVPKAVHDARDANREK